MTVPNRKSDCCFNGNHYWFKEMLHYFGRPSIGNKPAQLAVLRGEVCFVYSDMSAPRWVQDAYNKWLNKMITIEE